MNREQLVGLGLSEEQADKVIEGFKDFIPRSRFNEVNEAKKRAEAVVAERDKQIEDLKKATGDAESLRAEITKLQSENKAAKEKYDADLLTVKRESAIEQALTSGGAKNIKAVKALLDMNGIEFDGEKIKGLDKQLEKLKESDGYLFESKQTAPSGMSPADPNNKPTEKKVSEMNYTELAAYMAAGGKVD